VTDRLLKQGCERIVMFPLYPQYSATTTATVNDKFFEVLMKKRFMPAVRTIPSYEVEPVYIEALAQSIEKHLATLDFKPEVILASYHGIPKSYSDKGDPYRAQCLETSRLLRARLGMDDKQFRSTFQSRFGPEEWLQPYTDETLVELAKQGIKSVAVLNPGFVVDCLETVDEIGHEAAEEFHEAGGENFSHIPCLNDSEEGMKVIETLVRRELQGWV
jgi:ferrochelatase